MRRRLRRARTRDEAGFTLPEMLVALAIETVIFGALATAFVVVLNGGSTVNENLKRSSDARFAAAFIVSDARNSSGPETSLTDMTGCSDPSPPVVGTQTPVVQFTWTTTTSAGVITANSSDYALVSGSLLRRHCEGGALVSDVVLASSVADVTVACAPVAGCTDASVSITVTITETLDPQAPAASAPYTYSLTAAFRKLIGGGAPLTPVTPHPVILLGGPCGGSTGVSIVGSSTMRVYGDAFINTADGSGCQAMKLDGGGSTFSAGSTNFLAGGTCSAPAYLSCPPSTSYPTPIADPYAGLAVPSTSALTNQTNSCSSYGPQTAQPGVYANPFSPGGGATCTLATGVYYLKAGLNTNSGGITIKSAAGGVLIYVAGGSVSITGGSTFTISALASPSPYAGIAVWQAAADTSAIGFSGDATIVVSDALYAPKAQLVISGGSHAPFVNVLVVRSIDLSNSGHLVVGAPSATPLSIGASGFPRSTWTVNRPYPSTTLIGQGGDGNYTWSVTGMPVGMSFNTTTGVVSGTPTVVASGAATVTLTDALGDDPTVQSFTMNIVAGPSITTTSPLANAALTAPYINGLAAAGGTTPYIWSATGLPTGLTIGSTNGIISGTPTGAVGTSTVVVTLTDASGSAVNKSFSLTVVAAPSITTTSLPSGERTISYNATLAATGGTTPYNWSASSLPAGLSLNSGSGVISGTASPRVAVTTTFDVTLTDAVGATDVQTLTLVVAAQPVISLVTLANGTGALGTLTAGDTVTVVFSAQMSVNKFCSTWSNDALNQSLSANNDVTVSVSNAANDTLTVTSATCSFNFGSINLASAGYVSVAATFKGTSANASKITWTTATHTLVITLGAKATGTVAAVATSTPIYTASTAIKDSAGAALTNSPFTLPAGKKF